MKPLTEFGRRNALVLGFIFFVIFARLAIIGWCAPLVPYWDEWPATAIAILKPWHGGNFLWPSVWASHNGHRIVLTRLWEISWFVLLGEWDPTTVAFFGVLLVTFAEAGLVVWIARDWQVRSRILWLSANILFLAVPYGYANLLVSFQSQFYFFILLSLAAILGAARIQDSAWALVLTIVSSTLALFSVAAGLFAAVTVVSLMILQIAAQRRWSRPAAVASCCSTITVFIAWMIRPPMPSSGLAMPNIGFAAVRYAGWPASNFANLLADWPNGARYFPPKIAKWPPLAFAATFMKQHTIGVALLFAILAVITYWPSIKLLIEAFHVGPQVSATWWVLIGIAGWAALNALAMAVARSDDPLVPSRYQDLLLLGIIANAGALFVLQARNFRPWTIALWAVPVGLALVVTAAGIFAVRLPEEAAHSVVARQTVQAFIADGDVAYMMRHPTNLMPIAGGELQLAEFLRDPGIRVILPAELRGQPVNLLGRIIRFVLRISLPCTVLAGCAFTVSAFVQWPTYFKNNTTSTTNLPTKSFRGRNARVGE